MSDSLSPKLQILYLATITKIITQRFTIRVHAGIARKPWARLWYLARGFDLAGRGFLNLPADTICQLLAVSRPTLYEWLRLGKREGAFRRYKFQQNRLSLYLGGLHKVCQVLNLPSWGATATVPLMEVNQRLRAIATGIVTTDLQKKSHYAAKRSLKKSERRLYTPPTAEAILAVGKQSSQKLVGGFEKPTKNGASPFLLHVGPRVAFVSKSFTPFGAAQKSIGYELNISERTVQRHQRALGLERRQLAQAKAAYRLIVVGMQWGADEYRAEPEIWSQRVGSSTWLYEPNGTTSSKAPGNEITPGKLFNCFGKTWLFRCNLYDVSRFQLNLMKASQRKYELYLDRFATSVGGGEHTEIFNKFPSAANPPGKERQNP